MSKILKILVLNIFVFILFLIDRVLKYFFSTYDGDFFILGDWLTLRVAYNSGIAFGLPINNTIFLISYFVIFLILVWWLISSYKSKKYFNIFALTLIIAGAFSNLLDRLYIGKVIDYIDIKFYSIFNLADVMIVLGVIVLLMVLFLKNQKNNINIY